jgi:hypothetical protein
MRGAIPPLPQYAFIAWCLVKHRDNFTFTFMNGKTKSFIQKKNSENQKKLKEYHCPPVLGNCTQECYG